MLSQPRVYWGSGLSHRMPPQPSSGLCGSSDTGALDGPVSATCLPWRTTSSFASHLFSTWWWHLTRSRSPPKCSPDLKKTMTCGVIQLWAARQTGKKYIKLELGRERRKAMLAESLPRAWHCSLPFPLSRPLTAVPLWAAIPYLMYGDLGPQGPRVTEDRGVEPKVKPRPDSLWSLALYSRSIPVTSLCSPRLSRPFIHLHLLCLRLTPAPQGEVWDCISAFLWPLSLPIT